MKNGYLGELRAREKEIQESKVGLENFYMMEKEDEFQQKKEEIENKTNKVDELMVSYGSTVKSVKLAVEPYLNYDIDEIMLPNTSSNTSSAGVLLHREKQQGNQISVSLSVKKH